MKIGRSDVLYICYTNYAEYKVLIVFPLLLRRAKKLTDELKKNAEEAAFSHFQIESERRHSNEHTL